MIPSQELLHHLLQKHQSCREGRPATYIPELAKANPEDFAIAVVTNDGKIFSAGTTERLFSLQSTSKPFIYGLALEQLGREYVHSKVGVEPTGEAFNSIVELEKTTHRPYNPMINSGAIAVSNMIVGSTFEARVQKMLDLFSDCAGRRVSVDENVFESERKTAHRNRSIAHLLRHFGVIDEEIEETLDLYFRQCSIMVNVTELATMAATLATGGTNPLTKKSVIRKDFVGDILSLMFTCGMYDSSGEWAFSVGIPAKSGVSGAIFGVIPGEMGIAVYSPPIDQKGNSLRGVRVFQDLSRELNLSIFKI